MRCLPRAAVRRMDSGVRRSWPFRLVALLTALLVSLAAPALAVTHALAHAHFADGHAGREVAHATGVMAHHDDDHHHAHAPEAADSRNVGTDRADRAALGPADHTHRHGRATVDVAPGAREGTDDAPWTWPVVDHPEEHQRTEHGTDRTANDDRAAAGMNHRSTHTRCWLE